MKVSIITPSFNSSTFIRETVDSVICQTYKDWELIICDDGSDDGTIEILKKYVALDQRIKLIQNEVNFGPAVSRNNAIKHASGDFIAFLDSDDVWMPEKLAMQISFMLKNNIAFSFSPYIRITENGDYINTIYVPSKVNYDQLLKSCHIGCLTAVYSVKMLGKVYMPNISKRQDFALWLKILRMIPFAYSFPEVLAKYRVRKNSISNNKFKAAKYQWKVYREVENLGFFRSVYYFCYYSFLGFTKTYFSK
ncbi:glycosyltransferase family 2 protein [Pleomorphovibrio marinus]|uniref:glycosyltransferase family 2 protein n=1 Tax=Pleomorphovibrio marinus TaxID=2164132 RepID=UPI000E0B2A4B|nr:glycosyltransferase family 2 protein [Pleomorphovibrio marinus]